MRPPDLAVLESVLRHIMSEHAIRRELGHVRLCLDANPAVVDSYLAKLVRQWRCHPDVIKRYALSEASYG